VPPQATNRQVKGCASVSGTHRFTAPEAVAYGLADEVVGGVVGGQLAE
jgi:hypothetical protein